MTTRDRQGRIATDNERLVLDIVHRNPGISRSYVTKHTGITQQSVHRLVDSLISKGFLKADKETKSGPGQPSLVLTLVEDATYSFGISLNTDAIQLSLVDLSCTQIDNEFIEVNDPNDRKAVIKTIISSIASIAVRHKIPSQKIIGVGFAITGYRLDAPDKFQTPPPLSDWAAVSLTNDLVGHLHDHVWIENNANASAIAETLVGVGRNHPSFSYLSFNHGFGSGIIIDGRPLTGAHMNAGELSTIFTIDQVTSRPALHELIIRLQRNGYSINTVTELREKFDPNFLGVREWIDEVLPHLNLAIRALSAISDPSTIVFGGEAPPELLDMLMKGADPFGDSDKREIWPARPTLSRSEITGDAASFGAALIPIKQQILL